MSSLYTKEYNINLNMSGHSKWSTIKRAKGAKDVARGALFSKLSKAISIAVREGGSDSIDSNYRLRIAVEAARVANMPKDNIDRAINKAASESANLIEVTYEGFGPNGIGLLIDVVTDNKNRSAQEVKYALERNGGSLGGPGSVSFNFESKGYLLVEAKTLEEDLLAIIDMGADDIVESEGKLEVFVPPKELFEMKEKLTNKGFSVVSAELIKKPTNPVELDNQMSEKIEDLIGALHDLSDVENVYVNAK